MHAAMSLFVSIHTHSIRIQNLIHIKTSADTETVSSDHEKVSVARKMKIFLDVR